MKLLVCLVVTLFVFGCANSKKEKIVEEEQSATPEITDKKEDSILVENEIVEDTVVELVETKIKREPFPTPPPIILDEGEFIIEEEVNVPMPDEVIVERSIHEGWSSLLNKHVSSNGRVNYVGFKKDYKKLFGYISVLKANTPKSDWSKANKLAYWMNVYNAYTVKLIVDNYPLKSITGLAKPWDLKFIELDGQTYSLGDVENDILRKMGEPKIHFGINCASISCPKLANFAFTEKNVYSKLRLLTVGFMNDSSKNEISPTKVKISKLFEWYKDDFTLGGTLFDYINKYSTIKVNADADITYKEYDWNLNN